MKTETRIRKIEAEIRQLCANIKTIVEPGETKKFKSALVKELRLSGYIAVEKWEQGDQIIPVLGWKYGTPVAIEIRDGEDYINIFFDGLNAVKFEKNPEYVVGRIIINLEGKNPEDHALAKTQGFIWIQPGELDLDTDDPNMGSETYKDTTIKNTETEESEDKNPF